MTVDCLWELEKAIFSAVSGDGTISGLVSGIFSHVPQDTAYPYIKFRSLDATNWSTKTNSGIKSNLVLDVYSQERSSKDVLDILVEIKRVLDGATLAMTGCTMISMAYNNTNVSEMSDGLTWQGSIGFNVMIQKN